MQELYKTVSTDQTAQTRYQLESRMLEFIATNEGKRAEPLRGIERAKVANYAGALQDVRQRNGRVEAIQNATAEDLQRVAAKYLAPDLCMKVTVPGSLMGRWDRARQTLSNSSRPNAASAPPAR